jgi:hypothetical protein
MYGILTATTNIFTILLLYQLQKLFVQFLIH